MKNQFPIDFNATGVLSEYAAALKYTDIPEKDVDYTRLLIADYMAASFAGYKLNTLFNSAIQSLYFDAGGKEESTVLLASKKLPAASAAFVNACYAHGADMDDGNRKAMGHVGAHVISAVFALAETLEVTEQDVITAIVVGYDVYCRVAASVQPGLVNRGFHSTGTAGAIACAAACAKLLGLNANDIYNAIAISVTQACGLLIVGESGQQIKPINPANAARAGILSALLVRKGVTGGNKPLESVNGWCHAMSDNVDEAMISNGLGQKFSIRECYIKPYPACRHTHCGIELVLNVRSRIDIRNIKAINLYIYENAIKLAGQIRFPQSSDEAKFSIHYTLACALINGVFGLDDLDTTKMSDEVRKTISKIHLIPDASMEQPDAGIRGARIEILLSDESIIGDTVLIPKGDPEKPFTIYDIKQKIKDCAQGIVDIETLNKLLKRIEQFGRENKPFKYLLA